MKIKNYKKIKKNCYQVFFDNGDSILLYDEIILKYNLLLKKEISSEELKTIKKENDFYICYYKAIQYLAYKSHAKKEIRDYLKKQGFSLDYIEKTIYLLEEKKIINEAQYLEMYLHDQIILTNNGPNKIKNKLLNLGFLEESIQEKLNGIEKEKWLQKLEKIIGKKIKANRKDGCHKINEKIMAYCLNEGFLKEDILAILEKVEVPNNLDALEKEALKLYQKLSVKYQGNDLFFQIKGRLLRKGFSFEEVDNALNHIKKTS